MTVTAIVSSVLILALAGCSRSTRRPNAEHPYPFAERIPPQPPWTTDFASGAFTFALTSADAEEILVRTKILALGQMPPKRQVLAFNVLLDQPDALGRFRRLAVTGESAGRLYALAALTMLSPEEASGLARTMAESSDEVMLYDSDVVSTVSPRTAVALVVERRVGEECRRLRDSADQYFRKLPYTTLSTSGVNRPK